MYYENKILSIVLIIFLFINCSGSNNSTTSPISESSDTNIDTDTDNDTDSDTDTDTDADSDSDTPPQTTYLYELNYYPLNYSWDYFWTDWPNAKIAMDADLDIIASWGINTVRIFLMPDIFGFPTPSQTYLTYFEEMLALIDSHGLKAHVNLFDCWWKQNDISASLAWMSAIMTPYQNDPRIAVWELQNEMVMNEQLTRDWYTAMMPDFNSLADTISTVACVNKIEYVDDLLTLASSSPPDIISYHWYPEGDFMWTHFLSTDLDQVIAMANGTPLLLGEFGYTTMKYSENSHADLINDVLYWSRQKEIYDFGIWGYTDFPPGTRQCVGIVPEESQQYYGLLRTDGSEKPALAVLKNSLDTGFPAAPAAKEIENQSFEDLNRATSTIDNWKSWDQNWTGTIHFVQDCTEARTGNCSMKITSEASVVVGAFTIPALPVDSSKTYTLSAYVKTENLDGWAQLSVSWYSWDTDARSETYLSNPSADFTTTADQSGWLELSSSTMTPPADADLVLIFITMNSSVDNSYLWVDDISFVENP